MANETNKPNGPVAAALLAGGIGAAVFGLIVFIADLSKTFSTSLNWYKPVGPLTGKSILGTLTFFIAWAVAHMVWKNKEVNFKLISTIAIVLLVIGLVTTFPPFWGLFTGG
jgi:hypothetical protein